MKKFTRNITKIKNSQEDILYCDLLNFVIKIKFFERTLLYKEIFF